MTYAPITLWRRRLSLALLLALALLGASAPARAAGGPAALVKDFDARPYRPAFSAGAEHAAVDGALLFSAWDATRGEELWRSDGTPAGTGPVRDINPGGSGSLPRLFTALGRTLLFFADDGAHGEELWRSDGTAAGTALVKDVFPGAQSSSNFNPLPTALSAGKLFFIADDGVHGFELWVSDGTSAGTHLVKDILPASARDQWPSELTDVAGALFFITNDPAGSVTLWTTDGTPAGTRVVKSSAVSETWSSLRLTAVGQKLFLSAQSAFWRSDGTPAGTIQLGRFTNITAVRPLGGLALLFDSDTSSGHNQLWASDGTPAGTRLLREFAGYTPEALPYATVGGRLFSVEFDPASGQSTLWRTDGTPAGTLLLKTFPAGGEAISMAEVGGRLLIVVGNNGQFALWASDGSAAGTAQVAPLSGAIAGPARGEAAAIGGRMSFTLCGDAGCQLWGSDGTPAGTARLVGASAEPAFVTLLDGGFVRACSDIYGVADCGLLRTDGTPAGTVELRAGRYGRYTPPLVISGPQRIGGKIFFTDRPLGSQLWASDGTAAGTRLLLDAAGQPVGQLTPVGDRLFFTTFTSNTNSAAWQLWASDGTTAGTRPLKAIAYSGLQSVPVVGFAGGLVFSDGEQLWRSDGTDGGTTLVATLSANIAQLMVAGGRLYGTTSCSTAASCELWSMDSTFSGAQKIQGYAPFCIKGSCYPSSISNFAALGDTLFYSAVPPGGVAGLWRSDSSAEGTILLTSTPPTQLTAAGDRLFFTADDGAHGGELWVSDGSAAGTRLVKDISPGEASSSPDRLTAVDGQLFFTADDGVHGGELWVSDGSAAGTRLVKDISPGATASAPADLAAVNGQLFFSADAPDSGRELWVSDDAGTRLVQDLNPGPASAYVGQLMAAGPRLFFSADNGASGPALWALPLESQPFRRARVAARATVQAEDFDRGGEGLAYHDAEALSRRSDYRPGEGVDVDVAAGGYALVYAQPGEWLNYTLDIADTRAYTLTLSLASLGPGGSLHLQLDGADLGGPIRVPDTGGWDSWQTIVRPGLELPAGRHTLRLALDTAGASGYVGNIDWLSLDGSTVRAYLPEVQR